MKKKAFILTHLGLGDHYLTNGLVRYIANKYDDTIVVCKKHNENDVKLLYSDNNSIKILPVLNDNMISPKYGFNYEVFKRITNDYDIYLGGYHKLDNTPNDFSIFPLNFYIDFNIPNDIFWINSIVPDVKESKELYNMLVTNSINNYVVLHDRVSHGQIFETKNIEKLIGISKNDILFLNFNKNEYDISHKFYNIANNFICKYSKPIIYLKDTIINAKYIFLSDSCIFAMSLFLNIKTDNCYFMSRNSINYEVLYSARYMSSDYNYKKKFKQLVI
jgi:hypothetical protein